MIKPKVNGQESGHIKTNAPLVFRLAVRRERQELLNTLPAQPHQCLHVVAYLPPGEGFERSREARLLYRESCHDVIVTDI